MARTKVALLERRVGGIASTVASPMAGPVAAYIDVSQIESIDEQELLRLRRADTDTVVVEVARQGLSRSGGLPPGVYFKTDWAPVIRDRLAEIVASAHRHQLEAWAALSIRRMDWIEASLGWSDRRYNPASGELSATDGLDLFHPAVWEYLLGLLLDLAATGIDGIFLMAEPPSTAIDGFSPFALRGYQRDMGQALDVARLRLNFKPAISSSPEFWRWIGWKQREQRKDPRWCHAKPAQDVSRVEGCARSTFGGDHKPSRCACLVHGEFSRSQACSSRLYCRLAPGESGWRCQAVDSGHERETPLGYARDRDMFPTASSLFSQAVPA